MTPPAFQMVNGGILFLQAQRNALALPFVCESGLLQVGKTTEGDMIDPQPERKEGFASATFDLEAIRWQRAR
jgi:hypothetical protein